MTKRILWWKHDLNLSAIKCMCSDGTAVVLGFRAWTLVLGVLRASVDTGMGVDGGVARLNSWVILFSLYKGSPTVITKEENSGASRQTMRSQWLQRTSLTQSSREKRRHFNRIEGTHITKLETSSIGGINQRSHTGLYTPAHLKKNSTLGKIETWLILVSMCPV